MPYTTPLAVSQIIELDDEIPVEPFIETAHAMVVERLNVSYMPERLELIERWLSAHFYAIRDPRTTQERAGSVGVSYQSKVDLGLNVTHYGQQAMALDTLGLLNPEAHQPKAKPVVAWLGMPRRKVW